MCKRYVDLDEVLRYPFANGQYDHDNANKHFIYGCESYREYIEGLQVYEPTNPEEMVVREMSAREYLKQVDRFQQYCIGRSCDVCDCNWMCKRLRDGEIDDIAYIEWWMQDHPEEV